MEEQSVELKGNEPTSSIEVDQNGKGEYSYKIKFYFDVAVEKPVDVIRNIKETYDILHNTFGGK